MASPSRSFFKLSNRNMSRNNRNNRNNRNYDHLPRADKDTSWTDPITLNTVPSHNAYYLRTDLGKGKKITAVYRKSTLDDLVRRRYMISPMTRKPFKKEDIREAPYKKQIHPDLEGGALTTAITSADTTKYVFGQMTRGEALSILPGNRRGRTQRLTVYKMGGSEYKLHMNLTLNYEDKHHLTFAVQNLATLLLASTTDLTLFGSFVFKDDSAMN